MGQQQTKEENINYQNYKPNPQINQPINKQPTYNQNPPLNINQPQQPNQGMNTGVNIRPQYVPDNRPKYKGSI
jgi:hypothetical protein